MCAFVVGFEGCAGGWLGVAHFGEGIENGAAVSRAGVYTAGFGFGGGADNVLESLAKDVVCAVVARGVGEPSEVVMGGDATASSGLYEVGGIRTYLQDHVASVVADGGGGICVEIVHEHIGFGHGVGGGMGLFGSDFVEGDKDAGVTGAAVVHEGAIDGLDAGGAVGIEGRGGGDGGRLLLLVGAIDGFNPRVRDVLWTLGDGVVEFFQRVVNVAWHGDVDVAVGVVPVQGESAVEISGPVGGELSATTIRSEERRGC